VISHERKHSGEPPYICDVCNKAYSDKSNLLRPKHKHSGERPYVCDVCNEAYSNRSNLIRQKQTHSGECCYTCEVCNKACWHCSLNIHQHTHCFEGAFN